MMAKFKNFANSIPLIKPKRNAFDLSYDWKGDGKFGALLPVLVKDVIPGDTFKIRDEVLLRFDALIAPILHNVNIYLHYFFVPNRLLWDDWELFITGGPDGTAEPVEPCFRPDSGEYTDNVDLFQEHSLADYLGIPPVDSNGSYQAENDRSLAPSLLPFKAYQKIYNDYYRDQNFTDEIDVKTDQGGLYYDPEDIGDLVTLRYRCWEKDYFTASLPWTQRGVQMSIPFNVDPLPVSGDLLLRPRLSDGSYPDGSVLARANYGYEPYVPNAVYSTPDPQVNVAQQATFFSEGAKISQKYYSAPTTNVAVGTHDKLSSDDPRINTYLNWLLKSPGGSVSNLWHASPSETNNDGLAAQGDVSGAPTINDLRVAMRIQEWLERNAVGGSRYIEQIYAHFGVRSSDSRLQRAEYLGGGKIPVVISEVQQTSESSASHPQGNLSGEGIGTGTSIKFKKFFEEHGYIIGIMSIMPRSSYCNGVPRMFLRQSKFEYFWPKFAHLGEQPIYNQELFWDGSSSKTIDGETVYMSDTFGYIPRYSEYRYSPNVCVGSLRSSKSFWHLSRIFDTIPLLNENFVTLNEEASEALDRIFATTGHWPMTVEIYHHITAKRPVPKFGTPML